jgi:hypothetical protein
MPADGSTMSNHLAAVLSRGIERLAQGQTIEQYMGHVDARNLSPQERQELHELLELSARLLPLREVAIPAAPARAANRARFLSQAVQFKEGARERSAQPGWRFPAQLRRGLVGVAVSLALLLVLSSGAVSAAAASLPGSPLYPLKLTVEDVRLSLTSNPPARASLYLRFANERTNEMLRLTATGHTPSLAVVARLEQQLRGALQSAEAAEAEQQRQLLTEVIDATNTQQETLSQALNTAPSDAQAALEAGVATAVQTAQQAHDALDKLVPPSATPTSEPSDTAAPSSTPSKPAVVPVDSATPMPSDTVPAAATTTHTAPPAVEQPPTRTPSRTPSATPSRTATPGVKPSATLSPEPSRTASATASPVSPTATATSVPPTPTDTPQPTDTPAPRFRLTNDDNPDPVPASYRIHYVICVVNEGDVALTNVAITAKWSPRECLYYLPGNPLELSWDLGTVDPGRRECVLFSLNTYSICGGRTAVNEASMSCDQGSASAVQYTQIAGTPTPTLTPTITTIVTPTLTLTPTNTLTPTATLADTPTLTATRTSTSTWTPIATETAASTLTPTSNGMPTTDAPDR